MSDKQKARESVYRHYWRTARLDGEPFTEIDYRIARHVLMDLSQRDMASRLGICINTASRYERGRTARGIPEEIAAKIEQMVQQAMN